MAGGIAMGAVVQQALAAEGIVVAGHRWMWEPGRKGGTFEPHKARDRVAVWNPEGFVGDNAAEWGALPREGVNRDYCMCSTRWILRGAKGRLLGERNPE